MNLRRAPSSTQTIGTNRSPHRTTVVFLSGLYRMTMRLRRTASHNMILNSRNGTTKCLMNPRCSKVSKAFSIKTTTRSAVKRETLEKAACRTCSAKEPSSRVRAFRTSHPSFVRAPYSSIKRSLTPWLAIRPSLN